MAFIFQPLNYKYQNVFKKMLVSNTLCYLCPWEANNNEEDQEIIYTELYNPEMAVKHPHFS